MAAFPPGLQAFPGVGLKSNRRGGREVAIFLLTTESSILMKNQKHLLTVAAMLAALTTLCALAACTATTGATANGGAASAGVQKQTLLTQAGFVTKTVSTPKQKAQVEKLPMGVVSAVKYQGKLYYVYPTAAKDHILIGKQQHYNAYKKALAFQQEKAQLASASTQSSTGGVYLSGETAGPNRIVVQEMDGFGPIQDQPEWQ